MDHDKVVAIAGAVVLTVVFGMFSSCTYYSAKDYNACVIAAKTPEIAKSCERAK